MTTGHTEPEADFYRYLLLDRSDPEQCAWVLAIPVDRESFPVLLDSHGSPLPGELRRAAATASRILGYTISTQPVPHTAGTIHRVMVPLPQEKPHPDRSDAGAAEAA